MSCTWYGVYIPTVYHLSSEKRYRTHLGPNLLILRGHDLYSWPTTPSGKVPREERRAAHGALGGPAFAIEDVVPERIQS